VTTELTESRAANAQLGRRALLGAGVGGAAISLLPTLTSRAAASSDEQSAAAPTTAAPPRRPTDADIDLLAATQQFELTARGLYDAAIAAGDWSDSELAVITTIRETHEAAAHALAGLLGGDAPGEMSQALYDSSVRGFEGSLDDRLAAAYQFESSLVASHTATLGQLEGIDGAILIAAVQSVEARHGTVLADLGGQSDVSVLLVLDEAEPLEVTG